MPLDLSELLRGRQAVLTLPSESAGGEGIIVTATFGRAVKFSLRTRDRAVAAARNGAAVSQLNAIYAGMRGGPRALSQRETAAYAGEVYRLFIERFQENPGTPELWAATKAFNRAVQEGRLITGVRLTPDSVAGHIEAAQETFGGNLTEGVNSTSSGTVEAVEAIEQRFGWLVDWVLSTASFSRSRAAATMGTLSAASTGTLVSTR